MRHSLAVSRIREDGIADDSKNRSYPTRPRAVPMSNWRRGAWIRRVTLVLFAAPIVGALFGLVGLRHADVRSDAAGYELRVRYPEVSRAGIASPFDIYVRSRAGFDSPITLKITHDYFTLFDLNGIFPEPSAATVEGDMVVWEFDRPNGNVLRVHVDWRVQPSVHRGSEAQAQLVIDDQLITDVDFVTTLRP